MNLIHAYETLFGSEDTMYHTAITKDRYSGKYPLPASDKGTAHSYLNKYNDLFKSYTTNPNLNVLEIGICQGGSIALWHEYFPNANVIVGIDNGYAYNILENDSELCKVLPEYSLWIDKLDYIFSKYPKSKLVHYADAYTESSVRYVNWLTGNMGYDIIIDDGSHLTHHQVYVLQEYIKLLTPNGVLVIEDCNPEQLSQIELPQGFVKSSYYGGKLGDDNLFIVQREI